MERTLDHDLLTVRADDVEVFADRLRERIAGRVSAGEEFVVEVGVGPYPPGACGVGGRSMPVDGGADVGALCVLRCPEEKRQNAGAGDDTRVGRSQWTNRVRWHRQIDREPELCGCLSDGADRFFGVS